MSKKLHEFTELIGIEDFINIELSTTGKSVKRFITPYSIVTLESDEFGYKYRQRMLEVINSFFTVLLSAIRNDDEHILNNLISGIGEAEYIRLGYGNLDLGRGIGLGTGREIINSIKMSEAYKTGLIKDIKDISLYVENVGDDRMSDLLGNLLMPVFSGMTYDLLTANSKNENDFKQYKGKSKMLIYSTEDEKFIFSEIKVFKAYGSEVVFVPESICKNKYKTKRMMNEVFDNEHKHAILKEMDEKKIDHNSSRKAAKHYIMSKIIGESRNYDTETSYFSKGEFLKMVVYMLENKN